MSLSLINQYSTGLFVSYSVTQEKPNCMKFSFNFQHSGLVFHVLVSIISCLEDPKFENFRGVMDAYIADHFAAALVYK